MKKQLIIGALSLAAILLVNTSANAQTPTATATMNLILSDVVSIDASSTIRAGAPINFTYNSAAAYNATQEVEMAGHLVITSNKSYGVTVTASDDHFSGVLGGTIPINVMNISVENSGDIGGSANVVTLDGSADQPLIVGATLGSAKSVDIKYSIPQTKSSSTDILGKTADTYTAQVTYTVTAN